MHENVNFRLKGFAPSRITIGSPHLREMSELGLEHMYVSSIYQFLGQIVVDVDIMPYRIENILK